MFSVGLINSGDVIRRGCDILPSINEQCSSVMVKPHCMCQSEDDCVYILENFFAG